MGTLVSDLSKYQKAEVVEYMLSEPLPADTGDWQAKTARLMGLCLKNGIEFFHDPDQRGWACGDELIRKKYTASYSGARTTAGRELLNDAFCSLDNRRITLT